MHDRVSKGCTCTLNVVCAQVWATGWNANGQLGLGDTTDRVSPEQLPAPTGVAHIAAGLYHTMFVCNDGRVWGTGKNGFGGLGLGDTDTRLSPELLPSPVEATQVAAGNIHTVFLDRNGHAWATGGNTHGQLGLGDSGLLGTCDTCTDRELAEQLPSPANVVMIAAGETHTLFVDQLGQVRLHTSLLQPSSPGHVYVPC